MSVVAVSLKKKTRAELSGTNPPTPVNTRNSHEETTRQARCADVQVKRCEMMFVLSVVLSVYVFGFLDTKRFRHLGTVSTLSEEHIVSLFKQSKAYDI